jgi:hypothetical protein
MMYLERNPWFGTQQLQNTQIALPASRRDERSGYNAQLRFLQVM